MEEQKDYRLNLKNPNTLWVIIYSVVLFITLALLIVKTMEYD